MEKITLLVMWFALLFLASPVFAEYAPPNCRILEKPTELTVTCATGNLTLVNYDEASMADKIESIVLVDAPFSSNLGQFNEFQNTIKTQLEQDKKNGVISHVIKLPSIGKYSLEVNGTQLVSVSFGDEFLQEEQSRLIIFLTGIFLSAILGAIGLWVIFSKNKLYVGLLLLITGLILFGVVSTAIFV